MNNEELVGWLFSKSGTILRYRVALEFMNIAGSELDQLRRDSLATPEVQRWLDYLGEAQGIHGSKDTDAENTLAKLLEYGYNRMVPEFDIRAKRVLNRAQKGYYDSLILFPFLVRAGYADHPLVVDWLIERVEKLYQSARRGSYDFYLSPIEASGVPKAWKDKPIYRDEFGSQAGYALPTCYDFYAIAYCPLIAGAPDLPAKLEAIVTFLSDPRFQSTVGGYGWDRTKKRCYAAGRTFLACVEPARLVMFLEMGARFHAVRQSEWFQQGLATLEAYQTAQRTYRFPAEMLAERTGYYIYSGSHMGLGENRRSQLGLELESTFRMLVIQKRMRE